MRHVSKLLWIVPLAAHLAYLCATADQLPPAMGEALGEPGISTPLFLLEWLAITALANLAFLALHLRLPQLSDRMLQVPGHRYWLSSTETRGELVARIRFTIEATLLSLNVFLVAVYQLIYESSVPQPIVVFAPVKLIVLFMALPLLTALVLTGSTMLGLWREAKSTGTSQP